MTSPATPPGSASTAATNAATKHDLGNFGTFPAAEINYRREADTTIDDPELIDWRGGGPEVWTAPG